MQKKVSQNGSLLRRVLAGTGVLYLLLLAAPAVADVDRWTHFTIESPLPGEQWGCGGPVIADFDGDGDLDMALSRRTTRTAYWYERVTDEQWIRHTMGSSDGLKGALGMAIADLNGDGWPDVVSNRVWLRNPGDLALKPDTPWPTQAYDGGGHDIVAADINRDGRTDIVSNNGQLWFNTAADLEKVPVWTDREEHFHGGVAPRGVGDLDSDGDLDIVMPGLWFANPGQGRGSWARYEWPHLKIPRASYGTSARSWVVDLNGDGWRDIVYSDCDTGHSHMYWVENLGRGANWKRHKLTDPPTQPGDVPGTGSFHSLGVADFDGDGDLDIFGGEQEDPDTYMEQDGKLAMKPRGLKERGVVWENTGSRERPEFRPVVFQVDNPGWHEATLGDVDGDGDLDIVSKIWNADGDAYHADYWRNDNRSPRKSGSIDNSSAQQKPVFKPTNHELQLISVLSAQVQARLPETSGGWEKHESNPVLGGKLGTCFDVAVLRDYDVYKMYFSWRPKRSLALTESSDGIHWSEPRIVLGPTASGWEGRINRPGVVKRDNTYHLWYTGQTRKQSYIGYATSSDGVQFKRVRNHPVLSPEASWEKVAVMCPHVLWDPDANIYRMWYSAGDQYEPNAIGYATSKDGAQWQRWDANPIFRPDKGANWEKHKVTACQVVRRGDWHVMFYIGFSDEHAAHIGLARSRDGITGWQRHQANPIIAPGKGTWDANACYKPFAIFEKPSDRWLLWYNGRRKRSEQIGLAFHQGADLGWGQRPRTD